MSTDAEKLKQKQKIRKYLVFTGMFLLFLGCMWLIFAPSEKDRQEAERKTGFNAELPDPKGTGIEADKMAAYEQADMIRRQEEKKRTLADFSAYHDIQADIDALYADQLEWNRKAILNVANSGYFSSDRSIKDYLDRIWHTRSLDK